MTNDASFEFLPADEREPAVVRAAGDIDLTNVGQFQAALDQAAASSSTITADMTAVTYCDSATIRALFIAARHAQLTIQVSAAGPINETLLKVSGLDQVATVVTLPLSRTTVVLPQQTLACPHPLTPSAPRRQPPRRPPPAASPSARARRPRHTPLRHHSSAQRSRGRRLDRQGGRRVPPGQVVVPGDRAAHHLLRSRDAPRVVPA